MHSRQDRGRLKAERFRACKLNLTMGRPGQEVAAAAPQEAATPATRSRSVPMRNALLGAASLALLLSPVAGLAQTTPPGPDASMAAQAGEKPDKENAGKPRPGPETDERALEARSEKLKDSDIAMAP